MQASPYKNRITHQAWSTKALFIFATIGAAVGLGNIWKFPYTAGHHGGGAFMVVYILSIILIVTPILIAELAVGRHGRLSPINSVKSMAFASNAHAGWQIFGWMGMLSTFLILSFYSVIAGWILAYLPKVVSGTFSHTSPEQVNAIFANLRGSPLQMTFWHTLFMSITVLIVAKGLHKGIEKAIGIMMPSLFVMLILLVCYAAIAGNLSKTVEFLLFPDFTHFSTDDALAAVGQAFFSVSVGVGGMMTYAAYLDKPINIPQSALLIAATDTVVALLAGFAIFPIVFGFNIDPAQGPGLIFIALTTAFSQMPLGSLFGSLFFILLTFAALSSSIPLLEPIISWCEEQTNWTRKRSAITVGGAAWLMGLVTVLSFSTWSDLYPLAFIPAFEHHNPFHLIDEIVTQFLIPIGAIILSIFVGWFAKQSILLQEFGRHYPKSFDLWIFLIRYLAPITITIIFIDKTFIK